MSKKDRDLSRRDFFRTAGAAGIGTIAASMGDLVHGSNKPESKTLESGVPTRPFGKTGVAVSILSLGGSQDLMSKQLLLRQALKMGVTYWDTAYSYGNSEEAIGNYFTRFPQDRTKVFLVTKTSSSLPEMMDQYLQESLEKLKTSYIDLYFIHKVSNVEDHFNRETKAWAEKTKARGKIRFFGFSTHKNMENCLMDGARLGWIDGIMTSYNYRLMHKEGMKKAVEVCSKAGIGLTAMKTQAPFFANLWAELGNESEASEKITEHFMRKGFTMEQAKLKAVWENHNIASICSEMTNMTILKANVSAAIDQTRLSMSEKKMLDQYAKETADAYCSGCADICESSPDCGLPVSDVLRYLMYFHGYEDRERARRLFNQIPSKVRRQLSEADFFDAERKCPRKISITRFMKEAVNLLT